MAPTLRHGGACWSVIQLTLLCSPVIGLRPSSKVTPASYLAVSKGSKSTTSGILASPRVARAMQSASIVLGPNSSTESQWPQGHIREQSAISFVLYSAEVFVRSDACFHYYSVQLFTLY